MTSKNLSTPTKFEVFHSVANPDTHWEYLLMAHTDELNPRARKRIHAWMSVKFGPPSNRWSLRWTDYGLDLYFHQHKDFATFMLFFAEKG